MDFTNIIFLTGVLAIILLASNDVYRFFKGKRKPAQQPMFPEWYFAEEEASLIAEQYWQKIRENE